MKNKFLLIGGVVLLLANLALGPYGPGLAFADLDVSTYQVNDFESDNIEVGATFEVTVTYTNNTGSSQTIVGALFYFDYDTTCVDRISDLNISSDNLGNYLTSKTNSNFNSVAGEFRYQRDAGSGDGITIADGASINCFTVQFHAKQDDSLAGEVALFSWVSPSSSNVILTVSGGTNVTGAISDFQNVTFKASAAPTFAGIDSASDPGTGNTLNINWPLGASVSTSNHDNDSGTPGDTSGAATYYSNALLKHRVYRDGVLVKTTSTPGDYSWTNSSLNDMQEYTFNVEAIDNCSPTPNESSSGVTITGTPHDYEGPGVSISITGIADQQISLSWNTSDSDDLGGYIVVRKEAELGETVSEPPDIDGASGDVNGTSPENAESILEADGWIVVADGTTSSLTDTGLDNSKRYYYYAYAYDKTENEGASSPIHQGYNYSKEGTSGVPGAEPNEVSEFRGLSNITDGITLSWRTSNPPNYAGALIVYTTDYDEWTALSTGSAQVVDYDFTGSDSAVTETYTLEGLSSDTIYYFAAFAHNSSSLQWSDAVYTAAIPGGSGVTSVTTVTATATQSVAVSLQKDEDGYGINDIAIPFSPLYINGTEIANLEELINAINSVAGDIVITSVGFWDEDNQTLKGATFDSSGNTTYISSGLTLSAVEFSVGDAYQVSVGQGVNFTFTNYTEE